MVKLHTEPDPITANIWNFIAAKAAQTPDKTAITFEDSVLTYQGLKDLVDTISARLTQIGLNVGDHVAGMVEKSPYGLALTFSVMRIGAVFVPINPTYTLPEVRVIIKDSSPVLLVTEISDTPDIGTQTCTLMSLIETDAQTLTKGQDLSVSKGGSMPCAMLYTSGTTGTPKGAQVSHRNMCATFTAFNRMWNLKSSDRLLHVLPTYHAHGLLMATLCPLFAGGEIVLLPRFDIDRVIALLPHVSILMAVPTIHARLEAHQDFNQHTCRNLCLMTSGSAPLSPDLFDRIAVKTGMKLTDRYGSTEAGMITANPAGQERRGSVGKPLPGVETRIVDAQGVVLSQGDIGKIQVRGPHVFLGYWNRPDLDGQGILPGGWFNTGDFGRFDADGYLFIVGRDKDMIISGGFNVYPREVEIALEACEGVAEAIVFGIPHPDFGEGVVAVVRPSQDAHVEEKIIMAALASRLASYKRPKRIFPISELPKNDLGKIIRSELVDKYSATFTQSIDV